MRAGDFFNGKYVIEKTLGQGGMGTVYLARNIHADSLWAIKEVDKRDDTAYDLAAEPKMLKKLEHPALPKLFDILEQDGKLYMISDYINGISLDKKLEEEGRIEEEIVVEWAIQLCSALIYLHTLKPNAIIYRDMKPSNIILTPGGALKLIDFGIAREYKPYSGADTIYIGTPGYAAPEQFGTGQTSAASDIYSLGVTLHQLLTGKNPAEPPFSIKPIRYFDDSLSEELEAIIKKCTEEDIDNRFHSAAELMSMLEKLQKESVTQYKRAISGHIADNRIRSGFGVRRLVITIWDNAEFGCELAYAAAKYTNAMVILADLDLLAPKADLFLNLEKYSVKAAKSGIFGHSGLDTVMDAIGKGILAADILKQAATARKDMKNLHVITGNYRLENYEYYSEDSIPRLIEKCCRSYDITILLVNRSIYDAFTLASLLCSDVNIVAFRGDVHQFREFNTYIAFLKEKQRLPVENTGFVLFEYDNAAGMSLAEVKAAARGNLLGKIPASRKRASYRNMNSAYASHMEKEVAGEYIRLLDKLGVMPAERLPGRRRLFVGGFSRNGVEPV